MKVGLFSTFYIRRDRPVSELVRIMVDTLLHAHFEVDSAPGIAVTSDGQVPYWAGMDFHGPVPLNEAIAASEDASNWALAWRKRSVGMETIEVSTSFTQYPLKHAIAPMVTLSLTIDYPDRGSSPSLFEEFLAWSILVANAISPVYGWSASQYGLFGNEMEPVPIEAVLDGKPLPIEWANFFGREYIERIGLETIRSTPAWRVELLAGEGVVVVLGPHPDSEVTRETAAEVAKHLGMLVVKP